LGNVSCIEEEIVMFGDEQKSSQRDTFAALQQLATHSPSVAALQLQLSQGQYQAAGSTGRENLLPALGEQHLLFSLADQEFAVRAELVQGVERLIDLTPVPNVAPWVKGVMNLRGSIVSVVDLRLFLNLDQLVYSPQTRLLSLQANDMMICVVVDGVSEMVQIPSTAIISSNNRQVGVPQWAAPYITGSALLEKRVALILDVVRLLFSEKMHQYKAS
jgi:purine-binding chemotaxis protein CheW